MKSRADNSFPFGICLLVTGVFFVCNHDWTAPVSVFDAAVDSASLAVEQGSLARQCALYALAAFGIHAIWRSRDVAVSTSMPLAIAACSFVAWACASVLWADEPVLAVRKVMVLLVLAVAAVGMSRRLSVTQFAWIVFSSCSLYLVAGVGVELVLGTFAPLDGSYRFAGTLHPNHQAINCAALALASMHLYTVNARFKRTFLAAGAIAVAFLLLTRSRTAAGASFAAIVVYLVGAGSRRLSVASAIVLVCGAAGLIVTLALLTAPRALLLGRGDSDAETLTGRSELWNVLGDYAAEAPLAGHGYNAFWTPDRIEEISRDEYWTVFEGHSTYMDVLLGTGACGLFLYAATLLIALATSVARAFASRDPGHALVAAVLVLSACEGFLESALLTTSTLAFLFMWAIACTGNFRNDDTAAQLGECVVDLEFVHG